MNWASAAMYFLSNYSEWHNWISGEAGARIQHALNINIIFEEEEEELETSVPL
tara:strand:+ start:301 stop:459 length:159 start_codon:yes stop_codon:yes gene_type:complete